jgi:hypothetical protein
MALAALPILLPVISFGSPGALAEEPGSPNMKSYPTLEVAPPGSAKPAMTADELVRLKKELSTKRDRALMGKSGAGVGQPVKP